MTPPRTSNAGSEPPPPLPAGSGTLALSVLTDAALWHRITASAGGWPFQLYAFRRERVPCHQFTYLRDPSAWRITSRGSVLQAALAEDNLPMLIMGYEVRKRLSPDDPALPLLDTDQTMACAAHFGRVKALEWMTEVAAKEPQWWSVEPDLMAGPLFRNDIAMLELLFTRCSPENTRISYEILKQAVQRDDTASVKWAYDRGYDLTGQGNFRTKHLMDHAASLEMLEVMHSGTRDVSCTNRAMYKAAGLGDVRMVQFLHEHHTEECTEASMRAAVESGSLDTVRYLHEHGLAQWGSPYAMDVAAANGRLDIIKYLHENRTGGCTSAAIDVAARRGDMDILRFLHENRSEGCTKEAMDGAAANGHLEVVAFLHENRSEGCTVQALHRAVVNEHLDVCRFLCENRSEGATSGALDFAAARGKLEVVQLLIANLRRRRRKVHSRTAMDAAARGGHLEIVRLLHALESEDATAHIGCTTKAVDAAAANGHADVVRFLLDHRREGGSFSALRNAAAGGHESVLAVLLAQQEEKRLGGVPVTEGYLDAALYEARAHGHAAAAALLQQRLDEWRVAGRRSSP